MQQDLERWQAGRIARLTAPDGWLSLVALAWLQPGAHRIGAAADNDIVVANVPAYLGVVTLHADGRLSVSLDPAAGACIDGRVATTATLRDDSQGAPTRIDCGSVGITAIVRGGRKALRIRDHEAPTRCNFHGIERFPLDPGWRIVAAWQALDPPKVIDTTTVVDTAEAWPAPGRALFERDGRHFALYPVLEAPDDRELFLVFADATSGVETHATARFLYTEPPRDGRIVLDFNRAFNPPSAFTPHATCPRAPALNRLDLRVTAGELKYSAAR